MMLNDVKWLCLEMWYKYGHLGNMLIATMRFAPHFQTKSLGSRVEYGEWLWVKSLGAILAHNHCEL